MNLEYLREAIRLANDHMTANEGGPFGAVVVQNNRVIGRGWNRVTSTFDPTAHAEIVAIRDACSQLHAYALPSCEIYCSCEPCPLCLSAIYWARIDRIYYAATRDDAATAGFDDRYIYGELAKPPDQRSIPMHQALRDEGLLPLHEWLKKPDRIPY